MNSFSLEVEQHPFCGPCFSWHLLWPLQVMKGQCIKIKARRVHPQAETAHRSITFWKLGTWTSEYTEWNISSSDDQESRTIKQLDWMLGMAMEPSPCLQGRRNNTGRLCKNWYKVIIGGSWDSSLIRNVLHTTPSCSSLFFKESISCDLCYGTASSTSFTTLAPKWQCYFWALTVSLLIQLPANILGKLVRWPKCFEFLQPCGIPGQSFRPLVLAWLNHGLCGHLRKKPAHGRTLSLSFTLPFKWIN